MCLLVTVLTHPILLRALHLRVLLADRLFQGDESAF